MLLKKGARPGSLGPVQGRARPSAHAILATRLAWVYKSSVERREKKEEGSKRKKAETERRKKKEETERRKE